VTEGSNPSRRLASTYQPALDGIRALAVIAVMISHAFPQYPGGGYGVDVFFCLSGFLITSLLLAEWQANGCVRLPLFWARRALRLLPALAGVLVVVGLYAAQWGPPSVRAETVGAIPAVVGYWANWRRALGHHSLGLFGPTWSLSVEEQFYVAWPLLLVLVITIARRPLPWLATIAGVGALATLVDRVVLGVGGPGTSLLRLNGADARADQLLIGCALAVVCTGLSPGALGWVGRGLTVLFIPATILLGCLVGVGATLWLTSTEMFSFGLTLVGLSSAVVIGHVALAPAGVASRVLALPPLRGIGRISYGLYLWHYPVFAFVALNFHTQSVAARVSAEFAAALGVALMSFVIIERPMLGWKRRLRPAAVRPPAS